MKDKTELRRRKEIRTKQIKQLLKERGYKSPAAYKRYIDDVGRDPGKYPGKSFSSSATFRNFMDGKSVESDSVEEYADDLEASTDYLLGRTPYLHIGNKEISDLTGLSDASIEFLRALHSRAETQLSPFDNELVEDARMLQQCINLIFENAKITDDWPVDSFLTLLALYIYNRPYVKELENYAAPGEPPKQIITFEGEGIPSGMTVQELYRTTLKERISRSIDDLVKAKEVKNNGKH